MNNNIQKLARCVRRDLKNDINIISIIEYLKRYGYSVVFYNTPEGDEEIKKNGLQDKAKSLRAFSHCKTAKIIYIDNREHIQDKLYLLLHEMSHVLLKHIGDGKLHLRDARLIEIEANALSYAILTN